jgi:predicted hydrocarbon binding protein
MGATRELQAGRLTEDGIRYVMMRPDVLMGIVHDLAPENAGLFFKALENSAFRHAQASFSQYRARTPTSAEDVLSSWFSIAAKLGWGQWSSAQTANDCGEIVVHDSPFAAGHGPADCPVCGAITGVVKAMILVACGEAVDVREVACAAQGFPACRFEFTPAKIHSGGRSK